MKRLLLILLLLPLLVPAFVVTGFYAYENWTGGAAWRRVEATLRAAGEPLTTEALRPSPVPDARNMAAAPVFRDLFTFYNPLRASVNELRLPPPANALVPPAVDASALVALARRFEPDFDGDAAAAAQIVIDGIAPLEPLLDAVRSAAQRPDSVWPATGARGTDAAGAFLSPLRRTSEVLAARASAAVEDRQSARALADFELITRLAQRSNDPPMLAGCSTGQTMLGYALDIVGSGLAQGAWSEADLAEIETRLAKFHPLADFREGVRGERAIFLTSSDALTAQAEAIFTFIDYRTQLSEWMTGTLCRVAWNARPAGWDARDRAHYASFAQEWLNLVIHNGFIRPWALADWNARLDVLRRDPGGFFRTPLTVLVLPTFPNKARSAAYMQARLDFVRLACVIERYRRGMGGVPAGLDELVPRWIKRIPRDVVGGGRYFYRATGPQTYALYGKGWNARDDGGSAENANLLLGPSTSDDWVWASR